METYNRPKGCRSLTLESLARPPTRSFLSKSDDYQFDLDAFASAFESS